MRRIAERPLSLLIILILCSGVVWGQATAQISGTVRDQSGAVLPGVEVTATQTDTGIARSVVTNETGSYVLPNLVTGPYKLEAALPGFRTFVQNGIVLQVNATPVINPVLEVGQVNEQVEVQANAAMVETRTQGVGQVIENQRILELPLNGRNVQDLVTVAGAAVLAVTPRSNLGSGQLISIGGGLGYATDYSLDGASHLNFLIGSTMPMPFPDAAQEFKVESTGLSANRGNASSVSVVTKSGTNNLHGDLFEFVRNDLFNATQYFGAVNPATGDKFRGTLKRNQFGGTVGGPIVKSKLFFFGGYQATITRQDAVNTQAFITTPTMLAGDWTAFTSAACNAGQARTLRAPYVNNRIDPAQYSKVAVYIANRILATQPVPPNECGLVTFGAPSQSNEQMYVGKLDYQMSEKHSLFGRLLFNPSNAPEPGKLTKNVLAGSGGFDALASSYAIGDTYLISANTVQAFRLSVNRNANHPISKSYFSICDAGATDIYCGFEPKLISGWSITGGFGGLATNSPTGSYWIPTSYGLNDDLSLSRGNHQLALGFGALHSRLSEKADFAGGGSFTFNGSVTGIGMSDFMVGKNTTFEQGMPDKKEIYDTRIDLYATDSWKMTPRLTANYGLRWEPMIPQVVPDQSGTPGPIYSFDHDRYIKGIYSTVFKNAPAGFYYGGDPGFPKRTGMHHQLAHFAPRLGFAWDVQGDGRTSVRASFAYGFTSMTGNWREPLAASNPWGGRAQISNPPGGLDAPWKGIGNPFPYVVGPNAPFSPRGQFRADPDNLTMPQTYSWNLSVQRQIAGAWVASASYIATRALHLWTANAINPAIFLGLGPCTLNGVFYATCSTAANTDQRRLLSLERPVDGEKIGLLAQTDDGGYSTYHGMLLSLERRAAKGLSFSTNYTLSHCIGPFPGSQLKLTPDEVYSVVNNRNADRGNCGDSDRRQLLNLTALAQTPDFGNRTLKMLATGWRLSGIYRFSSGAPLDIWAGSDRALNGVAVGSSNSNPRQRVNQIAANGYKDKSGGPFTAWLDPKAFEQPALGTYGNVGYMAFVGPSTWNLDMALSRTFNLREAQRLEVRAEAFNVTNSFRPGQPNNNLSSNTFGVIRTALPPRVIQFALKYVF
jgi:carboxypeptidase family protein